MAAPGVRILSTSDHAQQELCKLNMSLKKLSVFSLLLPLLASSAGFAQTSGITDRAFSRWLKNSDTLDFTSEGELSLQGPCDGQKFELSLKSYGNFLRMKIAGKEFLLDESNFELPTSLDDLDQVRILRHGKSDKLAVFIPPSDGVSGELFYITPSKDNQSALVQAVDLNKTKDLERPIAGACILSVVPAQAISNESDKPAASEAPAPAPVSVTDASAGSAE